MRSQLLKQTSYAETVENLKCYHKQLISELSASFKFPDLPVTKFIALRKNIEIGFVSSVLQEWEYKAVFEYGRKHVYQEYFPLIVDFIRTVTIPRKSRDYGANISCFYTFPPLYYDNMIYSFFVNVFEKPIFKNFNSAQSILEQEIMAKVSMYFRKQNKYGPEQITVAILDEQFLVIAISGLLTPFLADFIRRHQEEAVFVERMFTVEARDALKQVLAMYFTEEQPEPCISFDLEKDKLIILSSLSQEMWQKFLESMSA